MMRGSVIWKLSRQSQLCFTRKEYLRAEGRGAAFSEL